MKYDYGPCTVQNQRLPSKEKLQQWSISRTIKRPIIAIDRNPSALETVARMRFHLCYKSHVHRRIVYVNDFRGNWILNRFAYLPNNLFSHHSAQ